MNSNSAKQKKNYVLRFTMIARIIKASMKTTYG